MAFSSALVLTDLNDYISPSQACIKPVEVQKKETDQQVSIMQAVWQTEHILNKGTRAMLDLHQSKRGWELL